MPRKPAHPPVTRINPATIRDAFRRPAPSDAGYYILEKGRTLVCLRVRKWSVKIGVRQHSRWYSVPPVHADMSVEEVEAVRLAALQLARQLQDGAGHLPAISRGRSMTLDRLHQEFLADMRETKGEVLREATIKTYADVWKRYLLPAVGHLTLPQLTVEVVRQVKRDIPPLAWRNGPGPEGAAGSSPIWRFSNSAPPWTLPSGWTGSRATWRQPRWCRATRSGAVRNSWMPPAMRFLARSSATWSGGLPKGRDPPFLCGRSWHSGLPSTREPATGRSCYGPALSGAASMTRSRGSEFHELRGTAGQSREPVDLLRP
jgi:hypothetical protein